MKDAIRDHRLVAILALVVLAGALFQEGYGVWAFLPVLPGLLSVVLASSAGPSFVLGLLIFLLMAGNILRGIPAWHRPEATDLFDLVLGVTCLTYVSAHWRLLSLLKQAVPGDPRRAKRAAKRRLEGRWLLPAETTKRTPERVPGHEIFTLIGQGVLFGVSGYLLWYRLSFEVPPPEVRIHESLWRLLLVVWSVLLALIAGRVVFAIVRWYLASYEESLMYLQDQFWSATRGEQRRIQAWVTKDQLDREQRENP